MRALRLALAVALPLATAGAGPVDPAAGPVRPAAQPADAPAAGAPAAPSEEETREASYGLGFAFGQELRRRPGALDHPAILAGLRDALAGAAPRVSPERMRAALATLEKRLWVLEQRQRRDEAGRARAEGEAFLARNAAAPGVVVLPSGLQYRVLREGGGPTPGPTDLVTLRYRGTLVDGTEFDASERRGGPTTVHVQGVMRGWSEALQRMRAGSRWELVIPPRLAYGERRFGRIPAESTLVFDLELLSVAPDRPRSSPGRGASGPLR